MINRPILFVLLVSLIQLNAQIRSKKADEINSDEIAKDFISIVIPILKGDSHLKNNIHVSSEAYLIYDNNRESIFEVFSHKEKKKSLLRRLKIKLDH